ncbi:MAG: hypothetical protein ABR927_11880 [Bacteroidales bacterium]|jgi:hypothetical protein
MKDLRKINNLTCWLVISFLFFQTTESKAQVIKMTTKDLTNQSTAVLYGKCSKIKAEWNADKSIIYTYVTVVPEEYIKGNLGSEVTIAIPGGQVGDIKYEVSDMPLFNEGEDIVAFIWTNPAGKNLITGGSQGKMKIEKDIKTGKRMVQGSTTDVVTEPEVKGIDKSAKTGKPEKVPLDDFVTKLKGYAKH